MAGEDEERTEAATPRRLQKAREEGKVPVSRELTGLAGLVAVSLTLVMAAPGIAHDMTLRLSIFLARAHELSLGAPVARLAGQVCWPVPHRSCWPRCSLALRSC